jgi:hypothetical protein
METQRPSRPTPAATITAAVVAGLPALVRPLAAARAIGVSARTLRRWTSIGVIRAVRIGGGRPMYPRAELERVIAEASQ